MNVARWVDPNFTTAPDAATYKARLDAAHAVAKRFADWFAPHQAYAASPNPDLAVEIDPGYVWNGATLVEVGVQTVTGFTIPSAGQHRVDRVVVDSATGVATRVAGTAATGSPTASAPSVPTGKIPICQVYITSADTAVTNSMITDERVVVTTAAPTTSVQKRHAIQSCVLSSGYSALLSAAAGSPTELKFDVDASPTPAVLAFAAGFDSTSGSAVDYVSVLTADQSAQGSLVAGNTNYVSADYASASSVTWGSYVVPPQYGSTFDQKQNSILNFEGTNGATTTTDDFGNVWSLLNGAQISTAQKRFGVSSLLLDGSNDVCRNATITTLGGDSWELAAEFRVTSLGAQSAIINAGNGSDYGVKLDIDTGGKIVVKLSSDGASDNIWDATGATTTMTTNVWNRVRLVFDALNGIYKVFLSVNGAAEVQEMTQASTARICMITGISLGCRQGGTQPLTGNIDAFRMVRGATTTVAATPSVSAPAVTDYPVHFFSVPQMKMYEVTTASAVAGTDPTMTARNRLFVGEADTSTVGVSAVRNYAVRGRFESALSAIALSTAYAHNHNLGVRPGSFQMSIVNQSVDRSWIPGDEVVLMTSMQDDSSINSGSVLGFRRNSAVFATTSGSIPLIQATSGTVEDAAVTKWKQKLICERGW